ncbi:MAG: hypothetical protein KF830_13750 [Planctomycetes bacterium]|nr:hypothetical protein [Planctomycetota bacterium]
MRLLATSCLFVSLGAPAVLAQTPQPKMGAPLHGLTAAELQRFDAGRVDFMRPFQVSDGLGPIFNQTNCASCHNNPVGGPGSIKVFRFGLYDEKGVGWDPLESLGGSLLQLNTTNIAYQEVIPPEANVIAQRVTPSVLGDGLIEAIDDADILANQLTPPSPGISGRAHLVVPLETPGGPTRVGRFGWKAQVATMLSFSADAALNELGITNRLLGTESAANGVPPGAFDTVPDPEDGPDGQGLHFIDRITDFQRYLAAPPQTPRSGMQGEAIFHSVGCADCHIAQFTTRNDPSLEAALRNKVIKPYSDFLLHDMGTAADFIGDGMADIQEIRTPPLWGVRTRDPLWHDGRVVGGTFEQRILGPTGVVALHTAFGSEARPSALAFQALPFADQQKVVAFLDSLGRAEFDWNGDGVRNRLDLAAFRLARNGGPYTADSPEAVFDFDQDGDVDAADLAAFRLVYEEDCNGNGINDLEDVLSGTLADANGNLIPDLCEFCQPNLGFEGGGTLAITLCGDDLTTPNSVATWELTGALPNAPVLVAFSFTASPYQFVPGEYLVPTEPLLFLVDFLVSDATGGLRIPLYGTGNTPTLTFVIQAATFDGNNLDLSNALAFTVGPF